MPAENQESVVSGQYRGQWPARRRAFARPFERCGAVVPKKTAVYEFATTFSHWSTAWPPIEMIHLTRSELPGILQDAYPTIGNVRRREQLASYAVRFKTLEEPHQSPVSNSATKTAAHRR